MRIARATGRFGSWTERLARRLQVRSRGVSDENQEPANTSAITKTAMPAASPGALIRRAIQPCSGCATTASASAQASGAANGCTSRQHSTSRRSSRRRARPQARDRASTSLRDSQAVQAEGDHSSARCAAEDVNVIRHHRTNALVSLAQIEPKLCHPLRIDVTSRLQRRSATAGRKSRGRKEFCDGHSRRYSSPRH